MRLRGHGAAQRVEGRGIILRDIVFAQPQLDGAVETILAIDEVLLVTDAGLPELVQGDVDFDEVPLLEEPADSEAEEADTAAVDEAVVKTVVKAAVGDSISEVRASKRLTESPACLVAEQLGPDRRLERILAHTNPASVSRPILELNMKHRLVKAIADANAKGNEDDAADLAKLLYEQAQILDGTVPKDPAAFTERLSRLIARGFD